MRLADVLREECIVPGAQFRDRAMALREIVALAKKCPILKAHKNTPRFDC